MTATHRPWWREADALRHLLLLVALVVIDVLLLVAMLREGAAPAAGGSGPSLGSEAGESAGRSMPRWLLVALATTVGVGLGAAGVATWIRSRRLRAERLRRTAASTLPARRRWSQGADVPLAVALLASLAVVALLAIFPAMSDPGARARYEEVPPEARGCGPSYEDREFESRLLLLGPVGLGVLLGITFGWRSRRRTPGAAGRAPEAAASAPF